MELRHLKYFMAVAQEGSIRRASQVLSVAQPSLSRQLRDLEHDLGVDLFERGPHGAALSEPGKELLEHVLDISTRVDRMNNSLDKYRRSKPNTFAMGYSAPSLSSPVTGALYQLRKAWGDIEFRSRALSTQKQLDAVQGGVLDVAFIFEVSASLPEGLVQETVFWMPSCLVVSKTHLLALRKQVSFSMLRDELFVGFDPSQFEDQNRILRQLCGEEGFQPEIVHYATDIADFFGYIAHNFAAGVAPESSRGCATADVVFVPIDSPSRLLNVSVVYRKNLSTKKKKILAVALEHWRSQYGQSTCPLREMA